MNFYFAATKTCNLRCKYCYVPEYNRANQGDIDIRAIVAAERLIKKAKDERQPLGRVCLHGAESTTLSPHVLGRIVNEFFENTRRPVKIQTNGTLLTVEYLKRLLRTIRNPTKLQMGFSIDGPATIHNQNRQGSWSKATKGLLLSKAFGFKVRILSVVNAATVENIEEFGAWCGKMDVAGVPVVFKLAEHGHELTTKENQAFAKWLIESGRQFQAQAFRPNTCIHEGNECYFFEFDIDGGVYSCNKTFFDGGRFADWEKESFEDIKRKRKGLNAEKHIDPACLDCPYWSKCKGGCSASRVNGRSIDCDIKRFVWGRK